MCYGRLNDFSGFISLFYFYFILFSYFDLDVIQFSSRLLEVFALSRLLVAMCLFDLTCFVPAVFKAAGSVLFWFYLF